MRQKTRLQGCMLVRGLVAGLLSLALFAGIAMAGTETQTDWSGGAGVCGPVTTWGNRFDEAAGVAWRSIPGQLALASEPLASPLEHCLADGYERPFGINAGDLDQDGDLDVVGAAGTSAGVVVAWMNSGESPPSWTEVTIDPAFSGASDIRTADIDGDGRLDIVAAAEYPGNRVAWWRNCGGDPIVWERQIIDPYFPGACSVDAADVNSDTRLDVLSVSGAQGRVTWWENCGGTPVQWTERTIHGSFSGAHSIHACDMDGDGDPDVLAAGMDCNRITWWRNDGGDPPDWAEQTICFDCTATRVARFADIDGDGFTDVVGGACDHRFSWWRNTGGDPVVWTEYSIDTELMGLHHVDPIDLDGDGDTDILATGAELLEVLWYENLGGNPPVWNRREIDAGYVGAVTSRAADVDGNGDLEVLGTSIGQGEFTWWEIMRFTSTGELISSILDTESDPDWAELDWMAELPTGTELHVQYRSSDNADQMGDWSPPLPAPGPLEGELGRYVQYRILFESADPQWSPLLQEMRCTWTDAAAAPPSAPGTGLHLSLPNPQAGSLRVLLAVPPGQAAGLRIYDVLGRNVWSSRVNDYEPGRHDLRMPITGCGMFFVEVTSGFRRKVLRVVMVE